MRVARVGSVSVCECVNGLKAVLTFNAKVKEKIQEPVILIKWLRLA